MATRTSTLLFRFSNFDTVNADDIIPDQVSDFTTGEGKWKGVVTTGDGHWKKMDTPAIDKDGIEWKIHLRIHCFNIQGGGVNPDISSHKPELLLSRELAGIPEVYERADYSVESLGTIKLRSGGIIDWPAHEDKTPWRFYHSDQKPVWTARSGGPWKVGANCGVGFTRDQLMGELDEDDSLILEVEVRNNVADSSLCLPRSSFVCNALKFLENGTDSDDVSFIVGEKSIAAHKLILSMNAPFLASLFKNGSSVPIEGCQAEVFRVLLAYVYGDVEPDPAFLLEHSDEIISAANKYHVVGLKLEAESVKVKYFAIDESNVVQNLIFAEQMNCAIIKEMCVTLFLSQFDDIRRLESFRDLVGSFDLLQELMVELRNARPPDSKRKKYSVRALLGRCMDLDLDYDGTKEMLVSRIKTYYAKNKKVEAEDEEGSESEEGG